MPPAFYTDEHVSHHLVNGLRQREVDVLDVPEAGMLGRSDEDHLALALRLGRVLYTNDADFLRLHARGVEHAGIVYVRQGVSIGTAVEGLLLVHAVMTPEEMRNHVVYL